LLTLKETVKQLKQSKAPYTSPEIKEIKALIPQELERT